MLAVVSPAVVLLPREPPRQCRVSAGVPLGPLITPKKTKIDHTPSREDWFSRRSPNQRVLPSAWGRERNASVPPMPLVLGWAGIGSKAGTRKIKRLRVHIFYMHTSKYNITVVPKRWRTQTKNG